MRTSSYSLIRPPRLKPGDTIGIVAPAWPCSLNAFQRGIRRLEKLGFKVKYNQAIFNKYLFLAGSDKERAAQINGMFADKAVNAIFCANGGYGSIRTLPYLDAEVIRDNPKIFVGYSDITILLVYLLNITRMAVFHGPIISREICEKMNPKTLDHLIRAITRPEAMGVLKFDSLKALRPGVNTGILVGGNASLLTNSLGTPFEIDTANRILFLEDNCDDSEDVDCQLMHLKLAGKLKRIKGLLLGELLSWDASNKERRTLQSVIDDALEGLNVPVLSGFPSGHVKPGELNVTLPLGVSVTLDADKTAVIINEAGVSASKICGR